MRHDNQWLGRTKRKFLPKSADRFQAGDIPAPRNGESAAIFLISLTIFLVFAYLFKFVWQLGALDALQHTSKALYLLYNQERPLTSLLLIQPPLPIFLQLVPVPIFRLLDAAAFSGPLLSSLFGAGALVVLNRSLLLLRVHDQYRWALLLLTQLYPSFLFAGAAGTTESLHIFAVLVILWGVMLINRRAMAFLVTGFGITLGFFIQYRIAGMLLSVFLALSILKWNRHENWQEELEGWLLAFVTPPLYAIGLWLLLNWLNQGAPFYFLNSLIDPIQSPSIARNVGPLHPYFLGWDNLIEAAAITAANTWETSLLFVFGILGVVLGLIFIPRRRAAANLMVILGLPAFLAGVIFLGLLPPWQYLWASLIPLGVILACHGYQDLNPRAQNWMMAGIILLTIASIWVNFQGLGSPERLPSEQRFHAILAGEPGRELALRASDPYWIFTQDARLVAPALDRFAHMGKVLVDGTAAAPVLIRSQRLDQMILQKNLILPSIASPEGLEAEYVLTLSMDAPLNRSTLAYPPPQLESLAETQAALVWSSDQTLLTWQIFALSPE